jgi:hypothetical protein
MKDVYVGRYIITDPTTTVIEGIFIKNINTGILRKYMDDGTMQQGYWNNGKFYRSLEIYRLAKIFETTPSNFKTSEEALAKWKTLGPFDV